MGRGNSVASGASLRCQMMTPPSYGSVGQGRGVEVMLPAGTLRPLDIGDRQPSELGPRSGLDWGCLVASTGDVVSQRAAECCFNVENWRAASP
jgi:hypothetical protein